jgi:hypothetical protein
MLHMEHEASEPRLPEPSPWNDLAEQLAREFDAPVGLLDLSERIWRARIGVRAESFPSPEVSIAACGGAVEAGKAFLWKTEEGSNPVWLVFPACVAENLDLIALVGFAASSELPESGWGPACPERALRSWGHVVADRLRLENESRIAPASSLREPSRAPFLPGRLIRRVRVSDPPERFQHLAVEALRDELAVEAVAWVPGHPREPVIIAGAVVGLAAEAYRALVPEALDEPVRIINRASESKAGGARRIAVVAADSTAPVGWLVAVNPRNGRPFPGGVSDLLQPVAALIAAQRANARVYADLKDLLFGVIRALTSAIDAKDPYTSGHSERVARIAVRLGEELGMTPNQRGDLYLMGLLHDVGKIGIEDGVLKKPGRLTPEEFKMIQSHVRIGVHILSDLKKLHHLLPGVAHHHECLDGSGYPSGLAGESIPLAARILAVADAFDAMSSSRPYRRRMTPVQIDDEFRKGAGTQWDPKVVDALFACRDDIDRVRQKGLGESLHQVVDDTLGRS